jgi:excisionase family DNA binding protein
MRDNLITVREAANYLRISARTVYRLIESGQIGAVRIGKQWRIPVGDLPGRDQVPEAPQTREHTASA